MDSRPPWWRIEPIEEERLAQRAEQDSFEKFQAKDQAEFDRFCKWFSKQPYRQRLFILTQLWDLHESLKIEMKEE